MSVKLISKSTKNGWKKSGKASFNSESKMADDDDDTNEYLPKIFRFQSLIPKILLQLF